MFSSQTRANSAGVSLLLCNLSSDMKAWKNMRLGVGASDTALTMLSSCSRCSALFHASKLRHMASR